MSTYLKLDDLDNLILATKLIEKLSQEGGMILLSSADKERADRVVFLSDSVKYCDKGELLYNYVTSDSDYGILNGFYSLELEELEANNFTPVHFKNKEALVEHLDNIHIASKVMNELVSDKDEDIKDWLRGVVSHPYMPLMVGTVLPQIRTYNGIITNIYNLDDD